MPVSPLISGDTHSDFPGEHGRPYSSQRFSSSADAEWGDPQVETIVDVQTTFTMIRYALLDHPMELPLLLLVVAVEIILPFGVVRDITVLLEVLSLTMNPSGELRRITLKRKAEAKVEVEDLALAYLVRGGMLYMK